MKRKATDWEEVLAKNIGDKGIVSRIYKECSNLIFKMAKVQRDSIEKTDDKYTHEMLKIIIVIRKMHTKTVIVHTSIRMAMILKTDNAKFREDMKELELSCTAGGNGKKYNYFRKPLSSLLIRDIKRYEETFGVMERLTIQIVVMDPYAYTDVKAIEIYTSQTLHSLPNQSC